MSRATHASEPLVGRYHPGIAIKLKKEEIVKATMSDKTERSVKAKKCIEVEERVQI